MKKVFNLTTSEDDLQRFQNAAELEKLLQGFDGVELMYFGEDQKKILSEDQVIGLHMHFFPFWLDFWNHNEEALLKEFDNRETWEQYYGGSDRDAIIRRYREDLKHAHRYGAEYVVFHVSDASIEESFTWNYHHTSEEVVDATAELVNEIFKEEDGSLILLLENLWQPGLQFTDPKITKRLMDQIQYPNKGIMLDTGHLLHTNTALNSQEEGVAYIHKMLDEHGELCKWIRGIHLNQSLTGTYCEETKANPPAMEPTYAGRYSQMFFHAFAVDKHEPFTCNGVREMIQRISPEYVNFEFITADLAQHTEYLERQMKIFRDNEDSI